ncbi:MAG: exodeoxyribonuclease III [Cytophagales bacterium]|nr:exodeoxyribonuclease III [Cytophagales bacterium]MDW8384554.1 exodeoxyribonuclease III [Flammeovirgaceae bacterium]
MVKIASYNVNGIRSAIQKGLVEWLAVTNPDILCLQEIKASKQQIDFQNFEKLGYQYIAWNEAQQKGYSGVAIFSKYPFESYYCGIRSARYDNEGRAITVVFPTFYLCNIYIPSGTSGNIRQQIKYEWLNDFDIFLDTFPSDRPLIIGGDFNICHTEKDIHNPVANKNSSGFLPEERAWLSKFFEKGFVDAFRYKNPHEISYTWWSYRFNARKRNLGWRIDYFAVSSFAKENIVDCNHQLDAYHSDHCPVLLTLSLSL